MPKKYQKTLSIGLSSLLALGLGTAQAAERMPNVLHEMVPHVVLPETVQYNKTAKNMPGSGYTGVNSSFVATYVAYPSYQAPYNAEFKTVGQSVYPVSPPMLPQPISKNETEPETSAIEEELIRQQSETKTEKVSEPIRLASVSEEVVPTLPAPNREITQTGIFCQQPAEPPSAWAFSSPIFKIASVPAGWGGGQIGSINQNGFRNCNQQVAFQPMGGADPTASAAVPPGVPYNTFQMGRPAEQQNAGPQAQILPNGMVLLTMPPDHNNCGLIRCRANHQPRTLLLPPAPAGYALPQAAPQGMPMTDPQGAMMFPNFGMMNQMAMAGQTQTVPVTAMTPMGPAIVGYQQVPMMNPMMSSPMMNPQVSQIQQVQLTTAQPNPAVSSQVSQAAPAAESGSNALQAPADSTEAAQPANPMTLIATPYGYYAVQSSSDPASPFAQMQVQPQPQMGTLNPYVNNPYMGVCATPFGYVAMNPMTMSGMPMNPMGAFAGGQGGMSVSDMIQLMTFLNNNNKPHQRRARLMERIAERRENRKATAGDDPFAQLMQAWTTPYAAQDTTLRMPSRNAYPYGYFGVQASPISTANYGGYHNLYFGSTTSPGLR